MRAANLSVEQMELAIPKIDRRLADLEKLDVNSVNDRSDPRIGALETQLDILLASIFGAGTVEYDKYKWETTHLDTASINIPYGTPMHEVREGLRHGLSKAEALLKAIKTGFLEELEDAGGKEALPRHKRHEI